MEAKYRWEYPFSPCLWETITAVSFSNTPIDSINPPSNISSVNQQTVTVYNPPQIKDQKFLVFPCSKSYKKAKSQ